MTDPWRLKYERAEQHLDEFKSAVAEFTAGRKHTVTCSVETKKQPREWVYRVNIVGAVDPEWCLPVGDFLFNARAALDHIAVALNGPKRKNKLIYYPIHHLDPWRREEGSHRYVERDPRIRREFLSFVRHMPDGAQTFIRRTQPYALAAEQGANAEDHVLVILKRLNDTDKHRRLLVTTAGMDGARLRYPLPDGTIWEEVYRPKESHIAAKDGAVLMRKPFKVDVDFMGAVCIGFGRSAQGAHKHTTFEKILRTVGNTLTDLEPFVP